MSRWLEIPRLVRRIVWLSLLLGLLCLGIGLYGDGHGWWDDRGFATNVFSSFTGLLIGVPFALVVLSHLGSMQAEAANYKVAARSGRNAAREFQWIAATGLVRQEPVDAKEDLTRLRASNQQCRAAVDRWEKDPSPANSGGLCRAFERRRPLISDTFVPKPVHPWLTMISESWHRLDMEVRPRLLDVEARWIPRGAHVALRTAVRTLDGIDGRRLLNDQARAFGRLERHAQGESVDNLALVKLVEHLREDADSTHDAIAALLSIWERLPALDDLGS